MSKDSNQLVMMSVQVRKGWLGSLDKQAEKEQRNRSNFVRYVLCKYLEEAKNGKKRK